jgi:hypothetical protein
MARNQGSSLGYVYLRENNHHSLSLRLLMAISDHYVIDLVVDKTSNLLAELRNVIRVTGLIEIATCLDPIVLRWDKCK